MSTTAPVAVVAPRPFPSPQMGRLVNVELRKMTDTRSGRWLLAATVFATLAVAIIVALFGGHDDKNFKGLLEIVWIPLALLLPVVGILAATGEWSQRTALTTFALVPRRGRIVMAKLFAALILGVLASLAALLAAAVGTAIAGGSWSLDSGHVIDGVLLLGLEMLGGFGLGVLLMSPATAIVVSFILPTAFSILGNAVHALQSTWDWVDPSQTLTPLGNGDASGADWGRIAVSSLIWVVIPVTAGLMRTVRREAK